MSASQVTEAHKRLWVELYNLAHDDIFLSWPSDDKAHRLIADSEATAVALCRHIAAQLAAVLNSAGAPEFANADHALQWAKEISGLTAERDQLRAEVEQQCLLNGKGAEREADLLGRLERVEREVERLHEQQIADAKSANETIASVKMRAERAEAELAGIRALADRRNKRYHVEDTTHQLVAALDQALDIAQAELADEAIALRDMMSERDAAEAESIQLKKANIENADAYRLMQGRVIAAERDHDETRERALTLADSLDQAEAELAAERAKVKLREAWLCGHTDEIDCGSGQRSTTDFVTFDEAEAKGHVAKYKGSWATEGWYRSVPVRARAAIDAAVKEGAK